MKFIIKVSPEIIIKSKPVRKRTIKLLSKNINIFLKEYKENLKVFSLWDKIEIVAWENLISLKDEIVKILMRIPWIYTISEVIEKDFVDFENVFLETKDYFLDKISNKTFALRVHRTWIHDFNSMQAERQIGGMFLKNAINTKVNLSNPDYTIYIEIRDDKFFVIKDTFYWVGWYPVSFQWKVLSLISWWFDSGVSTYLSMKRWCEVDFLFFNLWGNAHELGVKQVANYLWNNFSRNYNAKFITLNFEELVKEILTKINHKYRWIILKRSMLKCASIVWQKEHFALIKWDSLWQVSSQTLINMSVINKASSMLVLRPLITYDKQEIINISKHIGTFSFACNMPEYCGVISDKPATKSEESVIIEEEKNLSEDIFERVISNKKVESIKQVLSEDLECLEKWLETVYLPSFGEIVIDIRDEEKKAKFPLILNWIELLSIPFYDINHLFTTLDQTKTYLFYCERGVLSKLHALYLKEKWFNNIKVLRLEEGIKCKK